MKFLLKIEFEKKTYITWKCFKRMKHVKSVKIDDPCGHGIITKVHFCSDIDDEPCTLFSIPIFSLKIYTILTRW